MQMTWTFLAKLIKILTFWVKILTSNRVMTLEKTFPTFYKWIYCIACCSKSKTVWLVNNFLKRIDKSVKEISKTDYNGGQKYFLKLLVLNWPSGTYIPLTFFIGLFWAASWSFCMVVCCPLGTSAFPERESWDPVYI